MNEIIEMVKLIASYIGLLFLVAYCVAMLMVMIISLVYCIGYVYDTIIGDWLFHFGKFVSSKSPRLKEFDVLKKVGNWMQPKEIYLRYETPLCTYCFSFTAVLSMYGILEGLGIHYAIVISFILYIFVYFVGMYRRCKTEDYYNKVLENNLDFLKLSFIPLAFLITIVGFLFTITGFRIQELDFDYFSPIIRAMTEYGVVQGLASQVFQLIKYSILLLILMYIASIPMQLVSYFIVLVIKYFKKYSESYKKLLRCYTGILRYLKKSL